MKKLSNLYQIVIVAFIVGGMAWTGLAKTVNIELKADLQQSVIPANTRQDAIIKISIVAPEVSVTNQTRKAKVNLAVVIDKSGSMTSANKIENAKKAAITALRMLNAGDMFSLVVYDTQARTIVPAQNAVNKYQIESLINSIRAGGSTALFAGVSLGANELRKHAREGFVNRILLLSDGLANVGPSSPKELGRLGGSLIKEGFSVSTVGVGNDYNEDLMTALAQNSDGNFYFVENSNDLPYIFSKELGAALKVAARSLTIRIEFPQGVKPLGVLGHNYKIIDNKMDIYFNQVYGGHAKDLILQVEVPPEKANRNIELASIKMNYTDVVSGKQFQTKRLVTARTSHDQRAIKQSVNDAVVEDFAQVTNAMMKEQAIQEADKGDFQKAQQILDDAAKQLEETAKKMKEAKYRQRLNEEAERSYKHAKQMKKNQRQKRFSNRKSLKGEAFQTIQDQVYQQKK